MSNSIKKRVERLSARSEEWGDVLALIRAKKRYSELTDEQKERYCRYYHGMDRAIIEEIEEMVIGKPLDFVLEKKPPKMSPEDEREHIAKVAVEIEEYMNTRRMKANENEGRKLGRF